MSDKLTPGQLRDLADHYETWNHAWSLPAWLRLRADKVEADEREASAKPAPELLQGIHPDTPFQRAGEEPTTWGEFSRRNATELPSHQVRLPGRAVVEVLNDNRGDDQVWLAEPGRGPFCWLTRTDFSTRTASLGRGELKQIPRPAWLTDGLLEDVQFRLDKRGIKLEGGR